MGENAMRFKVELLCLSEDGSKKQLFYTFVHAQNDEEALAKAANEYSTTHPGLPFPEGASWFSYGTSEEECRE